MRSQENVFKGHSFGFLLNNLTKFLTGNNYNNILILF